MGTLARQAGGGGGLRGSGGGGRWPGRRGQGATEAAGCGARGRHGSGPAARCEREARRLAGGAVREGEREGRGEEDRGVGRLREGRNESYERGRRLKDGDGGCGLWEGKMI